MAPKRKLMELDYDCKKKQFLVVLHYSNIFYCTLKFIFTNSYKYSIIYNTGMWRIVF